MPELLPIYERLVELAGGGDLAARFLACTARRPTCWAARRPCGPGRTPPWCATTTTAPRCSRAPCSVTRWLRPVIAMADCSVGRARRHQRRRPGRLAVVRRQEDRGRRLRHTPDPALRPGVLRRRARRPRRYCGGSRPHALQRDAVDREGAFATVYVCPGRPAVVTDSRVCTNHQQRVEIGRPRQDELDGRAPEVPGRQAGGPGRDGDPGSSAVFCGRPSTTRATNRPSARSTRRRTIPAACGGVPLAARDTLRQSFSNFEEEETMIHLKPLRASFKTRTVS